MPSSAILLVILVALVQTLISAPATFSERNEQLITSSTKEIESKIWEFGLTPQVVEQYAFINGLSAWGAGCGAGFSHGCTPYGYSAFCFPDNCHCVAGGYNGALNGLNLTCLGLYLKRAELKSQVEHKNDENLVEQFRIIDYFGLTRSFDANITQDASPPKVSLLEYDLPDWYDVSVTG